MSTVTYKKAKEDLDRLWDETVSTREPIVVQRRGKEDIAIIPADELAGYMETAHLLSSPANAKRLLAAIERSRRGEGTRLTLEEIKKKFRPNGVDS